MPLQLWGKSYELPSGIPVVNGIQEVFREHRIKQFWKPIRVRLNPHAFTAGFPDTLEGVPVEFDPMVELGRVYLVEKVGRIH